MKKLLLFSFVFFLSCHHKSVVSKEILSFNSFRNNPAPLYVLNGIIISSLDTISPSSIARIHVLKAEKATDKYGKKGIHGVIEVVTKEATSKP